VLPRGEGGAEVGLMFELRNILKSLGSRIAAAFFVLIIGTLTICNTAIACSKLPEVSTIDIFKQADVVFRGTVVAAESVDLPNGEDIPDGLVYAVKLRWHVEEMYKGQLEKEDWAITTYICGGVRITVGQPYIFSLSKYEVEDFDDEASKRWLKENPNMKWSLDERGTKGVFDEPLEYERLSKEFKKLSKK
jgi:hypothetical protein